MLPYILARFAFKLGHAKFPTRISQYKLTTNGLNTELDEMGSYTWSGKQKFKTNRIVKSVTKCIKKV